MGLSVIPPFLCGMASIIAALYKGTRPKLLNILNIIITTIIILLWLVVVFISVAVWCTSHPFIVKAFVTLFCLLVNTLILYIWLATKEVL